METATIGATAVATHQREGEPTEVTQVNKLGMIARMQMIAGELGAHALGRGTMHDVLAIGGKVGFFGAIALGAGSIANILKQGRQGPPPETVESVS
jgi:hypothetical protein